MTRLTKKWVIKVTPKAPESWYHLNRVYTAWSDALEDLKRIANDHGFSRDQKIRDDASRAMGELLAVKPRVPRESVRIKIGDKTYEIKQHRRVPG